MSADKYRKRRAKDKGKVHPDQSQDNSAFEMDSVEDQKHNNNIEKFKTSLKKNNNALSFITNIKKSANKWRSYATTRRKRNCEGGAVVDRKHTGGLGLEYDLGKTDFVDGALSSTERQLMVAHNRNLIEYFARLAQSKDDDESVNLEYVDSLLKNGARIDCTDKYGQTILHEVARAWHVDVAKFLKEHGANINQGDNFGRTPLHVAAAVDYPEMVDFLIENGANKESRTKGEHQTPTHFAARNDACSSLKALIKAGCEYKDVRDYKGRTPVHLAAELDRSETARLLLELDDPAPAGVTDMCGQSAIVWMITKMPPVAKLALDQFHTTDRANRRQYYHLHHLEPKTADDQRPGWPQTALRVCVRQNRYDLIEHEVFLRLIRTKWTRFGRRGAWISVMVNLLFSILWSAQGILVEYDQRHVYTLPSQWWRILLFVLAIGLTIYQLEEEFREYFHSKRAHKRWRDWRESEIVKDKKFAHPRWPEEEAYLQQEDNDLDKLRPQYFNDFWNIYDWICYAFLIVVIITHLIDVFHHTNFTARLHIRIMAVTIILLWLRLMKNARAFALLGPFIVMVGHMLKDVMKFFFLYAVFYIPYACAFWMLFGENKVPEEYQGLPGSSNYTITVGGMGTADALCFSLFRMMLVDDYDYDGMKSVDYIMADLLVGSWLAISAVLMLNMLIALLSDTFQRVYDNAKANALMQKAIFILNVEEGMSGKRKDKFRLFIHKKCAPQEDFYDDDAPDSGGGDELKKVTFQIKDQLDELQEELSHRRSGHSEEDELNELSNHVKSSDHYMKNNLNEDDEHQEGDPQNTQKTTNDRLKKLVTTKKLEHEMDLIRDDIQLLRDGQEHMLNRFKKEMNLLKGLLQEFVTHQAIGSPVMMPQDSVVARNLVSRQSVISAGTVADLTMTRSGYPQPQTSTLVRTGSLPPQNQQMLSSTLDPQWVQSEQRRREELDALRQQLHDHALAGDQYTTATPRPIITPNNTTEPDGDGDDNAASEY